MSTSKDRTKNDTAASEAVEWFVELQGSTTREQQEAFSEWLRRSPVHVEEFLQLTALQGDLGRLPELTSIDVRGLMAHGAQAQSLENVVSWERLQRGIQKEEENESADDPGRSARRYGWLWNAAAAAALVAVTAGLLVPHWEQLFGERYSTEVGEQRSLTLADGSQVQLNVQSSLSAKLSDDVRDVRLEEGEALFQVAKDPARPFRVRTPQATIEARGTQFNVHVGRDKTVVSLLEGHVEVTSSNSGAPIRLDPGQKVVIDLKESALPAPQVADLKTATAWTERRLVFEDATLAEVVDEFNRYSRQPLVIDDPELLDSRITASFESGDAQAFADSLAAAGRLRVTRQRGGSWLIERQ